MLPDSDKHYQLIKSYYGDTRAFRSKLPYMNHINEGLDILDELGATLEAKQAFCIHPIVQRDQDLAMSRPFVEKVVPWVLLLAVEYRSVANEYLSTRKIVNYKDIRLSPLPEVNDMLMADKRQNNKDFQANKHLYDNAQVLEVYFDNWMKCLVEYYAYRNERQKI